MHVILLLQIHTWVDGSIVSFQNWFQPVKDDPFFNLQGLYAVLRYVENITDIIGRNKYLQQPMLLANTYCTAILRYGAGKLSLNKWIKVSCDIPYQMYAILCEISRHDNDKIKQEYNLQISLHEKLSVSKNKNVLMLPDKFCSTNWLALNGTCWKFLSGNILTRTFTNEKCFYLQKANVSSSIRYNIAYVVQFLKGTQFYNENHIDLSICYSDMTSKTLPYLGFFKCVDGTLIIEHYECDGIPDCPDLSDEHNCYHVCTFNLGYFDNSTADCFTNCHVNNCTCHQLYYQCTYKGGCIPASRLCDGISDCPDNSDEHICLTTKALLKYDDAMTYFQCISGTLIDSTLVNDTIPDCPVYGDDEIDFQLEKIEAIIPYNCPYSSRFHCFQRTLDLVYL